MILKPFARPPRVMFWTDWGRYPKIEKADMTGDNRVVLVSSSLKWPNGLTLDREKNRLYWVDAYLHKLEYLDLSNDNRVRLINLQAASHPFGLTILGNYLYWSDWNFTAIYQAHKGTGGDVKVVINGLGQPMDIHGYNVSENAVKGENKRVVVELCSVILQSSLGEVMQKQRF